MPNRKPTGSVVAHPAVLEIIEGDIAPSGPQPHERHGRMVMLTRKTRLWFQADWVNSLPDDGIFLQRIQPVGGAVTWIAMTRAELEATFANVVERDDWGELPYHYPKIPVRKAAGFLIPGAQPSGPSPAPVRAADEDDARVPERPPEQGGVPGLAPLQKFNERWSRRAGVDPERNAYLAHIDSWRSAFRPERVRVLLLAESHVREAEGDDAVRVDAAAAVPRLGAGADGFCRLVYCLGYGGDSICNPAPTVTNAGTNYWTLFARLVWKSLDPASAPKKREQIGLKARLLEHLRARGVWLVDASALGIYQPGGGAAFRGSDYRDMIRESWLRLVRPSIAAEPLEQVVVIGRTVRRALGPNLGLGAQEWTVAQPAWGHLARHRRELAEVLPQLPWEAPDSAEN